MDSEIPETRLYQCAPVDAPAELGPIQCSECARDLEPHYPLVAVLREGPGLTMIGGTPVTIFCVYCDPTPGMLDR